MSAADDLVLKQAQLAHELLGDWYIRPDVQDSWSAAPPPLELFPDIRLRAIAELANQGLGPGELLVGLTRNGARQAWPQPAKADEFLLSVAGRGRAYALQVSELEEVHHRRKLRDELHRAVGSVATKDHDQIVAQLESARRVEKSAKPFEPTPIGDMFRALGPEPWLCHALAIQPGAPVMVSGNSGRGKSWICYDLALAVASGQTFGGLGVRRGRVHWYHLEGSARDLRRRMQHLARGRHLGPTDLDGWFINVEHPAFLFTDTKLEKRLTVELQGAALAVIDTFAVAASGMKENDASIRQPLDMLARVSGKTGCAFVVIHHHRKDPTDPNAKVDQEMAVRGSGALLNALSVGWAVTRVKRGDPTDVLFRSRLTMTKSWYGDRTPLEICGFFTPGIDGSVELSISDSREDPDAEPVEQDYSELDNAILDVVERHPQTLTRNALHGLLANAGQRARRSLVSERVDVLRTQGRLLIEPGPNRSQMLRPIPPPVTVIRETAGGAGGSQPNLGTTGNHTTESTKHDPESGGSRA